MHNIFMKRALQIAKRANVCDTLSNPLVGAVIVKKGAIISEGYYKKYGTEHAEVLAIKKAQEKVRGATLYCTLEPCTGTWKGKKRTPCVNQIIQSGIKAVYIASLDSNKKISGRGVLALQKAGVDVTMLSHYKKSENIMNEAFIALQRKTRIEPFVHLKIAQSLDGRMATTNGDSKWITNKRARDLVYTMRMHSHAICVGVDTILIDNPQYTVRNKKKTISPSLIILDSRLTIPLDSRCLQYKRRDFWGNESGVIICVSKKGSKQASKYSQFIKKRRILEKRGLHILELPELHSKKQRLSLHHLMQHLIEYGIYSLLVETGPTLTHSFLMNKLVDKLSVFLAPFFLGGDKTSTQDLYISRIINKRKIYNLMIKTIIPTQMDTCDDEKNILMQGYMHDFFEE